MDPHAPRHLRFRRALLGELLTAGRPVGIDALVDALVDALATEPTLAPVTPKRVSDVLRQQVRMGRVRRVHRGVYEIVPGGMSRATEWRCRNWHRVGSSTR